MTPKVMNEDSSGDYGTHPISYSNDSIKNKRFYVDIKESRLRDNICKHITRLGGRIDTFLSKDVNLLITHKHPTGGKATKGEEKLSQFQNDGRDNSNSLNPNTSRPLSRGAALLLKSKSSKSSGNLSSNNLDIIHSAKNMGIKIEDLETFKSKIRGLIAKVPKSNKLQRHKSDNSMLAWKDNRISLKIEDNSKEYKPLVKHLETFPSVYFVEHDASPFDGRIVLGKTNISKKEKIKPNPYNLKGGYCEMCDHWYKCKLKEHLNSDQHKHFTANQEHFQSLDTVMSGFCTLEKFLEKYKTCASSCSTDQKSSENHQVLADYNYEVSKPPTPFRDITNISCAGERRALVSLDKTEFTNEVKMSVDEISCEQTHHELISVDNDDLNSLNDVLHLKNEKLKLNESLLSSNHEQMSDESVKVFSKCKKKHPLQEEKCKSDIDREEEKASKTSIYETPKRKLEDRQLDIACPFKDLPLTPSVQFMKSPALKLKIRNLTPNTPSVTPRSRKRRKSPSKMLTSSKVSIRNFEDSETDELTNLIKKCNINDICRRSSGIMQEESQRRSTTNPEDNLFSSTDVAMPDHDFLIDNIVMHLKEDATDPTCALSEDNLSKHRKNIPLRHSGKNLVQSHLIAEEMSPIPEASESRSHNSTLQPVPMSVSNLEAEADKENKFAKRRKVRVCLFGKEKKQTPLCKTELKNSNSEKSLYTSVKTSDTKIHIKRCKLSPQTQSNNLKMYWRVRKTGDCRLVFCAEKRKKCDLDQPMNIHSGNEKKRQRCQ